MSKKKEEVKENETKKEEACACGEECKCKKGRVRRVIVTILLIIVFSVIAFGFGVATGGVILVGDDKPEVDNKDDVKEEVNEDVNEVTEDEREGSLIIDSNNTLYSYKTQLNNDEKLSFKTVEDVEKFIDSSNYFTDSNLRKALLEGGKDEDKEHFVIAYILRALDGGGLYYVDKSYLKEVAGTLFKDGLEFIPYTGNLYYSASDILYICTETICIVQQSTGGGGEADVYQTKVVGTKKIGENTIYTIQEYYSSFEDGIFTDFDEELLCEHDKCPEDIFKTYGDKLNTYEMTFDKNNRYVSSKKVK